jgi:predicted phage-related endonuclease
MDIEKMLQEFSELESLKKETEKELDSLKAAIIAAMNGADSITAGYHKATLVACKRTSIDAKRLDAELPLLYNQYSKQSTYNRFIVK